MPFRPMKNSEYEKENKRNTSKGTKALYKNGISQNKSTCSLFEREAVRKRTREERNRKEHEGNEGKRRKQKSSRIVYRLFRFL
jgi:hypothetical protein